MRRQAEHTVFVRNMQLANNSPLQTAGHAMFVRNTPTSKQVATADSGADCVRSKHATYTQLFQLQATGEDYRYVRPKHATFHL